MERPIQTVKMSSKGQIVIPHDIRESLHAEEGTIFAVLKDKDAVVLRKIAIPSKEDILRDLKVIAKRGKKRLQKKGIKESDISIIVAKRRKM